MSKRNPKIAVITGPRHGGPLRWATDLTSWINKSGEATATLIHTTPSILASQLYIDADIVHTTIPITLRFWRKPLVLTVKGNYSIEAPIWRPLYSWAVKLAAAVTVPSQYLQRRVPALASATVIPNAVDIDQFPVAHPASSSTLRLVMVTNFWYPNKAVGVRQVIDSFRSAVKAAKVDAQLTIVGAGTYLDQVKQSVGHGEPVIRFTGWMNTSEALSQSDLFVYYSSHDNMPNVVLEAMAAGLPVLTNRVGAVDEMIISGTNGVIVDTPEEYTEKLTQLLTDTAGRQRLGNEARRTIEEKFSWPLVIHRYLEIYRRLWLT